MFETVYLRACAYHNNTTTLVYNTRNEHEINWLICYSSSMVTDQDHINLNA